ncbi:FAD/NAD(P)-binding domain-containing protein [Fomes fomentarius]|nr:FAD/NAD(P)-binding domain-containing protein [Fomes fomentarius]
MSSDAATPKIAIVGGGLAGLTLLLTLHRRGLFATLYERDPNFNTRAHLGGVLDLGWTSGQRALRENGLQHEFTNNSRPEGEELKIYDASAKLHLHHPLEQGEAPQDPSQIRPEIDRTILRRILFDACPHGSIKWDHALTAVRPLQGGQHELTFANGLTSVCDILVGADGAHSRIRPSPELADVVQAVGQGSMFALQDSKMLGSQPNGDGRIRTYAFFRGPADWVIPSDPNEARSVLLAQYEGWAPWLRKLIEHCDDAAIYLRPLYILPVGHQWPHISGVTVIGDGAHLMSPFSGAGANLAMLDALELGLALSKLAAEGKLGDARAREATINAFEEDMCAMAGRVAEISNANLEAFVNPAAPQSAIARFDALFQQEDREG